jgi:hypothetical protein
VCTVGGFDRRKGCISLHEYRTDKRLTQGATVADCRVLSWVAFRSWFVREKKRQVSALAPVLSSPSGKRIGVSRTEF